jgi:hypothetical protein
MVAKVSIGKTIRGVLSYNENKVKEGTAACIKAEGFAVDAARLSFNDKLQTFMDYQLLNRNVKTNAVHISLNFDKSDTLTQQKLTDIAETYLSKIGFGNQPYLVYQHFDAAHPHVHLVTTNIKIDGTRIDLHNIGKEKSEQARKEIEIQYRLVKAQGRKQENQILKAADLSKAVYGKSETKRSISNIVNAVTRSYRFTSIHELNAILKHYNVVADTGKEGTLIHLKKGLRYSLIDKDGTPVGVPIKASSIYGKPTLNVLSEQFRLNETLRGPHKQRVKEIVDSFEYGHRRTLNEFIGHMVSNQVYPVIRQNDEGRIYGITFIDNTTKCVFNGSALGKQYSANGILNRLETVAPAGKILVPNIPTKSDNIAVDHIHSGNVESKHSGLLQELMEAKVDHSNIPYELRRKKKRKGRSI